MDQSNFIANRQLLQDKHALYLRKYHKWMLESISHPSQFANKKLEHYSNEHKKVEREMLQFDEAEESRKRQRAESRRKEPEYILEMWRKHMFEEQPLDELFLQEFSEWLKKNRPRFFDKPSQKIRELHKPPSEYTCTRCSRSDVESHKSSSQEELDHSIDAEVVESHEDHPLAVVELTEETGSSIHTSETREHHESLINTLVDIGDESPPCKRRGRRRPRKARESLADSNPNWRTRQEPNDMAHQQGLEAAGITLQVILPASLFQMSRTSWSNGQGQKPKKVFNSNESRMVAIHVPLHLSAFNTLSSRHTRINARARKETRLKKDELELGPESSK
ncbi:hypothetical protein JOM56_012120 [Amanita muscaria]